MCVKKFHAPSIYTRDHKRKVNTRIDHSSVNICLASSRTKYIESRWIQVNPGESRWIQVNPGESRWIQVNPGESRWIQVAHKLEGDVPGAKLAARNKNAKVFNQHGKLLL